MKNKTIHKVQFYETDAMGIVHHSNYFRFFEEARLDWLESKGLLENYHRADQINFAVIEASANYRAPAQYGDKISVETQITAEKLRLIFNYKIYDSRNRLLVDGKTVHVAVDPDKKPKRIPKEILELLESQNG
ncbi:MAG: acyl-CoA thioesterase [Bdellovibrionales bacterium]